LGGDEGVAEDRLQLAHTIASLAAWTIIALFTRVSDKVSTGCLLAVSSASVGFPVRVEETTKVALLSPLLDTITTHGGWEDTGSGDGSVVEGLDRSGSVGQAILGISEGAVLLVRHGLNLREHEPLVALSTWGPGEGTGVGEGSEVGGEGHLEGDGSLDLSLSAVVGDTETRTAIDLEVVVEGSVVALLSIGSIDDAITTEGDTTIKTASVGLGVAVVVSVVALLKEVDDAITTEGELAVETAVVSNVGIGSTEIALLASLEVAITTFTSARGVASVTSEVVFVVAAFTTVDHTITALGQFAVESAGILGGVAVEQSIVTEFTRVDDAITANGADAVSSAAVGDVGVVATVVALLGGVEGFQSATAHLDASGRAPPIAHVEEGVGGSLGVNGVALFTREGIDDTITTS